ncbi:ABC transporter, permease protein [Leuconostoc inhae]|uniref:Transport permease protein n=2 Tax=Leuconostoc TaxID=1243 RepID=A0AAN2UHS1_9LACO|nr:MULTISPECIES: ABC transporter permease [Leuconostoc]MBZ5956704.1 ABC transporter permease [Leuconostoc gasicomitatum]MBZ5958227.1 ABC transporter permease [Leuconostoc gasicomitatum]MBZ5966548.1 ABC transporter permease [Leuconostoc gasicomitatum]MBZ5980151.1 ABC transporter permease [Leuconostoc gasicomitatum]MBZ5981561.1 ABC transporter permease [Leuconostoc gasicomitatum]
MISRHLKIYFRDKGTIISSLIAILVTIALYVLFLGNYLESTINNTIGANTGNFLFVNTWVLSGIIIVSSVTVSLGIFGVKVKDDETEIFKSFAVSPVSKLSIVLSYIIAAWIMSFIITLIAFILWTIVMKILGYTIISFSSLPLLLLYVIINILSSTSLTFFIVNFVKSVTAFSSISTIVGTLTGFLAGIYLPIGALPKYVQFLMKFFPPTYGVAQIRSALADSPLKNITQKDSISTINQLKLYMGIKVEVFGHLLTNIDITIILLGTTILFTLLSVIQLKETSK